MQQEHFERGFSRGKHASGDWHTAAVTASSRFARWCAAGLSFKHRELDILTRMCHPDSTVLDFGCGNGAYAGFFLAGCNATVIAVDWSPEALVSIAPPRKGCLLAVCADLHALPFKASSFDALYSIDTLGHLANQERALDEISRVCRSAAPLFLHSECADYRLRAPDRTLIAKTGYDPIAAIDGHDAIRPAREMRALYERRFTLGRFYSPAGVFGWLLGYPEKYRGPLREARMYGYAVICGAAAFVKERLGMKLLFRIVNMATNRLELLLGMEGGGSCFAQARCLIAPASGGDPAVDIIIPSWRRETALRHAVDSIIGQCRGNDLLYVVHQGHGKLPAFSDRRIRVLHRRAPNLPAARNAGIAAGGNPIILFVDDDCTALPGLVDAHRLAYCESGTGAVAGFINDPVFPAESHYPSRFDITTGELLQNFAHSASGASISVMGANMSFRREALEAIGGFDRNYRNNALWEEIDASFRLQKAGYTIRYEADARVTHHRIDNGGCRSNAYGTYLFHTFANTAYFAATYAPREHWRTWLRFWKYRLEFLSRQQGVTGHSGKIRHNHFFVAAGLAGAVCGGARYFTGGNRLTLPDTVVDHYRRSGA
jgi:GT2 family glycosyltransferase/SAM-dependent methyltransferase